MSGPKRKPLVLHFALGLCFAGGLFSWQLVRSAQRLLGAAAQFGRFDAASAWGTVVRFELLVLLACLGAGLVVGVASASFAAALLRVFPRGERQRKVIGSLAFVLLLGLIVGREMAMRPALFETAYLKPDGTHGPLSWAAELVGPLPFRIALFVYLLVALWLPVRAGWTALGRLRRRRRLALLAMASAIILAAGGYTFAGRRANSGPNVLLLVGDSLRPDHISANGYGRDTTPNIDALMRQGTTFTSMYVPLARTIPSWTGMLTGLLPAEHGITTMFPEADARKIVAATVPRMLDRRAVHTAVVADYAGDFFSMVDYGFGERLTPPAMTEALIAEREMLIATPLLLPFVNHPLGHMLFPVLRFLPNNADPDVLTDQLLATLGRARRSDQFFVAAFYSVTHIPYAAPSPDWGRYSEPGYRGDNRYSFSLRELADLKQVDRDLPPQEVAQAIALYDGALHAFDRSVGRVLAYLESSGLAANTTVILLGDHGEVLRGGARGMQHGNALDDWDDLLTTCVIRQPQSGQGKRIAALHSNVDLAPTILSVFGESPAAGMRGVSLLADGQPNERGAPYVYFETGEFLLAKPRTGGDEPFYPSLGDLIESDGAGYLAIRPRYREVVELAKHRGVFDGSWLLRYRPGRDNGRLDVLPRSPAVGATLPQAARAEVLRRLQVSLAAEIARLPGARFDPGRAAIEMVFEQE